MSELQDLEERLRCIIQSTCNAVGCDGCDLKWEDGCSATELQNRIMAIELEE